MPLVTQATFTRFHVELKMYENTSYCEKSIIILPFDSNQLKPKCIYHTQILEGTSTVRSGSTSVSRCSFSPFHHVFFCLHFFFRFSFYAFTFFLIFLRKSSTPKWKTHEPELHEARAVEAVVVVVSVVVGVAVLSVLYLFSDWACGTPICIYYTRVRRRGRCEITTITWKRNRNINRIRKWKDFQEMTKGETKEVRR